MKYRSVYNIISDVLFKVVKKYWLHIERNLVDKKKELVFPEDNYNIDHYPPCLSNNQGVISHHNLLEKWDY